MRVGVIGIGSNSVRMLLADAENGILTQVDREREGTRLFSGLEKNGDLSRDSMEKSLTAICRMQENAMRQGAEEFHIFATSAVRDAGNGSGFADLILQKTGVVLEICSGEREAALSFLGATDGGRAGVIDIGGGSTEYVVGQGRQMDVAFSLQMGAVRLFDRQKIENRQEAWQVVDMARDILRPYVPRVKAVGLPARWFGTGGTFTSMAAIVKNVPWTEKTYLHGAKFSRQDVSDWMERLADLTVPQRLQMPTVAPKRADIVVHGIAILAASMELLQIESMTVSEHGNMDGYLKERYL